MGKKEDDARRRFEIAMYRGLRRHTEAVERQSGLLADIRAERREKPAEHVPARVGNVSDLERPRQLAMLMSIPGFAQEATRIPASGGEASGVTADGHVVCCKGTRTALELGSLVECAGGCGRFFTGTADKAFSFGPFEEAEAA